MINLGFSDILTALNNSAIGTRVSSVHTEEFLRVVKESIEAHDFESERVFGQAVIELPMSAVHYVLTGVGKRTLNPKDYVVRLYRGKVGLYLSRNQCVDVCDSVRVVVYTLEGYVNDPDVDLEEAEKVMAADYTHVLVAVLASAGPKSPLTPGRFVHNLAGGNNEALDWTADEIREKAEEITDYYNEWCTVAD